MSDQPSHHDAEAFTLIEVVIFIAISSIILISIVSLSVNITRQTNTSHHKLYATRYADELAEWLRIQKEISWQDFYSTSQSSATYTYCVNDEILLTNTLVDRLNPSTSAECAFFDGIRETPAKGPQIFKRSITFGAQVDNTKSVKGTIRVEWREAGNTPYSVQIETLFAPR